MRRDLLRLEMLAKRNVNLCSGFRAVEILHPDFGDFIVLGELSFHHVCKILDELRCVEVFDIFGNDRLRDADLRNLIPVGQVAIGHAVMSHDEEGIAIGIEGHGVAAVGEGLRAVFSAGQAKRAEIFKVIGADHVAAGLYGRKWLRFRLGRLVGWGRRHQARAESYRMRARNRTGKSSQQENKNSRQFFLSFHASNSCFALARKPSTTVPNGCPTLGMVCSPFKPIVR